MPKRREEGRVHPVTVERNVGAAMRDGVVLRADVARPKARGKFPALVTRTPYGKGVSTGDDYAEATLKTARQEVFHDARRPSRVILPVMR